jgi:hypothetical protein
MSTVFPLPCRLSRHLPGTRLAVAALTAALMLLGSMGTASAHFLGGRWPYAGGSSVLWLSYRNDAGAYPDYSSAVSSAASNWYSTPTPLGPYSVSGSAKIVANTIYDSSVSYWGITHVYTETCVLWFCWNPEISYQDCTSPCAGSDYDSATFTLNRYTMGGLTSAQKLKVATHEFGHGFGLGHSSCTAIMRQGYVSWSTPQTHDNYDVNQRYPSSVWSSPYGC